MGCTTSRDMTCDGATRRDLLAKKARQPSLQPHDEGTAGGAEAAITVQCVPRSPRRFHPDTALDVLLSHDAPCDPAVTSWRHRSVSPDSGYPAPQPSVQQHLERIQRGAGVAGVHGMTADVDQFDPGVADPKALQQCGPACLEWLRRDVTTPVFDESTNHDDSRSGGDSIDGSSSQELSTGMPPPQKKVSFAGIESPNPRCRHGATAGTTSSQPVGILRDPHTISNDTTTMSAGVTWNPLTLPQY